MIVAVVVVRRDEDVDGLDRTLQELAELLLADLEFDRSTVNSVDDGDGVATLCKHLAGVRSQSVRRRLRRSRRRQGHHR